MAQATDRLRRYLEDELGECRSEDVDARLDELRTLEATLGTNRADAGLVESRKDGRWKKYRATNRAIALVTVLDGSVGTDE